jgi:hypothetical protein
MMRRGCHTLVKELTVCTLEMPAIARANSPIDVFKNLYRIGRKLGMEAELTQVVRGI